MLGFLATKIITSENPAAGRGNDETDMNVFNWHTMPMMPHVRATWDNTRLRDGVWRTSSSSSKFWTSKNLRIKVS